MLLATLRMYSRFLSKPLVKDTVLFLLALALLVCAFQILEPAYSKGRYRMTRNEDWQVYKYPFEMNTPEDTRPELLFKVRTGFLRPSEFVLVSDDCVETMTINRIKLPDEIFPLCDYVRGRKINLSSYMHYGDNIFWVTLKNNGGPAKLKMFISNTDWKLVFLRLLLFVAVGVYLWRVARRYCRKRAHIVLWSAFSLGLFVRLYYFIFTRYEIRGHDSGGHLDYIKYLMENSFSMPSSRIGWEFYHPPLYYALSAIWMKFHSLFESLQDVLSRGLQVQSLIYSIATFVVVFWISAMLFPKRRYISDRIFFILVLALQPSFIFFTGRINNDALYQFFAFLAFALILKWWKSKDARHWYLAIISIALGMLTKSNALLLLPIAYSCLLMRHRIRWKRKMLLGGVGLIIITLMTGWFYVLKFVVDKDDSLVQNLTNLNSGLLVESTLDTLIEFNPVRLVQDPFNNAWNGAGRDHFWEYWMRSAFFGEFFHGDSLLALASGIILLALALFPLAIIGFYFCVRYRWYKSFPIWITAVVVALGHVAFRQYAPYSSSQDFRYSILFLVPITYFLLVGIRRCSKPVILTSYAGLLLLLGCFLTFILALPLAL